MLGVDLVRCVQNENGFCFTRIGGLVFIPQCPSTSPIDIGPFVYLLKEEARAAMLGSCESFFNEEGFADMRDDAGSQLCQRPGSPLQSALAT